MLIRDWKEDYVRCVYAQLLYEAQINMDRSRVYGSLYSQQTDTRQVRSENNINEAIRFISHEILLEL